MVLKLFLLFLSLVLLNLGSISATVDSHDLPNPAGFDHVNDHHIDHKIGVDPSHNVTGDYPHPNLSKRAAITLPLVNPFVAVVPQCQSNGAIDTNTVNNLVARKGTDFFIGFNVSSTDWIFFFTLIMQSEFTIAFTDKNYHVSPQATQALIYATINLTYVSFYGLLGTDQLSAGVNAAVTQIYQPINISISLIKNTFTIAKNDPGTVGNILLQVDLTNRVQPKPGFLRLSSGYYINITGPRFEYNCVDTKKPNYGSDMVPRPIYKDLEIPAGVLNQYQNNPTDFPDAVVQTINANLGRPVKLATPCTSTDCSMWATIKEQHAAMMRMFGVGYDDLVNPNRHFYEGLFSKTMVRIRDDGHLDNELSVCLTANNPLTPVDKTISMTKIDKKVILGSGKYFATDFVNLFSYDVLNDTLVMAGVSINRYPSTETGVLVIKMGIVCANENITKYQEVSYSQILRYRCNYYNFQSQFVLDRLNANPGKRVELDDSCGGSNWTLEKELYIADSGAQDGAVILSYYGWLDATTNVDQRYEVTLTYTNVTVTTYSYGQMVATLNVMVNALTMNDKNQISVFHVNQRIAVIKGFIDLVNNRILALTDSATFNDAAVVFGAVKLETRGSITRATWNYANLKCICNVDRSIPAVPGAIDI